MPRVVHQDIDPAGTFGDPIDGRGASFAVPHIDLFRSDACSGRLCSGNDFLRRRNLVPIEQRHVRALGREELDDRPADAAAAAGHYRDLAGQTGVRRHRHVVRPVIIPRCKNHRRRPACDR